MAEKTLTTAWTWLDDEEIRGLSVDLDTGTLHWFDQIGCHCTDEDFLPQTTKSFRQYGCPPLIGDLPADVGIELGKVLELVEQR